MFTFKLLFSFLAIGCVVVASNRAELLKDVATGQSDSYPFCFFKPHRDSNISYFTALIAGGRRGLFVTDGTPGGTQPLKGDQPTLWVDRPFRPIYIGGAIYFSDGAALYIIKDDTTKKIGGHGLKPKAIEALQHGYISVVGNKLYIIDGGALLALGSPTLMTRERVVTGISRGRVLGLVGRFIIFHASFGTSVPALWSLDIRSSETKKLNNLNVRSEELWDISVREAVMYFTAPVGGKRDLWCTDGSFAGTLQITTAGSIVSIAPFKRMSFRNALDEEETYMGALIPATKGPLFDKVVGGPLFFNVDGQLYANFGGRPHSTLAVEGATEVQGGMVVGGRLLFSHSDGSHGRELWSSDGHDCKLIKDILPGPDSSNPTLYGVLRKKDGYGLLFFWAADAFWVSDGSSVGTEQVISSVSFSSVLLDAFHVRPRVIMFSDAVYFQAAGNFYVLSISEENSRGYKLKALHNFCFNAFISGPLFLTSYTAAEAVRLQASERMILSYRHNLLDGVGVEPYVVSLK